MRYPGLAGLPRPRGNESSGVTASRQNATTPAKAGAQLGNAPLADAALSYLDLPNWAPAFAGVVPNEVVHTGSIALEAYA
jgi:hypothetical protein